MGWKQDLKKANKSGGGITKKEIKKINKQYGGVNRSDLIGRADTKDYNLLWRNAATNKNDNDPVYKDGGDDTSNDYSNFGYLFQDVIGPFQEKIANIQAGATTQSATIRGEADKEVARAYADAQKYASQLGLEGTKYASDKESEWRQAVANIEVKGKLDLQPIINAGLEKVAGIEAQASRDVAETTGKYSLESMKQRTAADKSIGKMQLAGSMYGLLGAAFG